LNEWLNEDYISERWDNRFINLAFQVAEWSSCLRPGRKVGCIIVKDRRILTTGYNGAPSGLKTCSERGGCMRERLKIPSGTQAERCYAVHAEQNAIIQAAKLGVSIEGATLYCTHMPCSMCTRIIINSGIKRIVYKNGYPDEFSKQLLEETDIIVRRID